MLPPSHYDAVVIGSGFGGTMTALPLAQAFKTRGRGGKLLMLERGPGGSRQLGPCRPSTSPRSIFSCFSQLKMVASLIRKVLVSCATLVPARARSTTYLRTSAGYLLGIDSSSLHAGGSRNPTPLFSGVDQGLRQTRPGSTCRPRLQGAGITTETSGVQIGGWQTAASTPTLPSAAPARRLASTFRARTSARWGWTRAQSSGSLTVWERAGHG